MTSLRTHGNIATEEDIPMSVVADEAMYVRLKKLGHLS